MNNWKDTKDEIPFKFTGLLLLNEFDKSLPEIVEGHLRDEDRPEMMSLFGEGKIWAIYSPDELGRRTTQFWDFDKIRKWKYKGKE